MSDYIAMMKKYAKKPFNEAAATAMVKNYQLVMSKPDARYVACADATERDRVRDNFLKKKLGLKSGDLDGAVKTTCEAMKAEHNKPRVVFYYLLAEHFDKLAVFAKKK